MAVFLQSKPFISQVAETISATPALSRQFDDLPNSSVDRLDDPFVGVPKRLAQVLSPSVLTKGSPVGAVGNGSIVPAVSLCESRSKCADIGNAAITSYNHRMNCGDYKYIWQASDWPTWRCDLTALVTPLAKVSQQQGLLLGRLADIGLGVREHASLAALTDDVIKTSEIEGEHLNVALVRSSIARRLSVEIGSLAPVDRHVEGVVEMVLDAAIHNALPLTHKRLLGWHAARFPTGYSGTSKISTGTWRDDVQGPMQVTSGPIGRQRVHYEAPPAQR